MAPAEAPQHPVTDESQDEYRESNFQRMGVFGLMFGCWGVIFVLRWFFCILTQFFPSIFSCSKL